MGKSPTCYGNTCYGETGVMDFGLKAVSTGSGVEALKVKP